MLHTTIYWISLVKKLAFLQLLDDGSENWHANLVKICFIFLMILFTNPSARAGYDTRSIFKRSLTGLNSEFSFS